jgi:hypothetical protein
MRGRGIPPELWDALYFLSVAALLTELLLRDLLPWPVGAVALTGAVAFRAFARTVGGVSDRMYRGFRIAFLLLILSPLLIRGVPIRSLLDLVASLCLHGLERILVSILTVGVRGELSLCVAFLVVMILLLLSRAGLEIGSAFVYRTFFCLVAPLFTLALMLAWWSQGDIRQAALVGGSVFSIFLFAEGAYLILRALMSRP